MQGVLDDYNIEVLGTQLSSMELVDDRDQFAAQLQMIGLCPTPFKTVRSMDSAFRAVESGAVLPSLLRPDGFLLRKSFLDGGNSLCFSSF